MNRSEARSPRSFAWPPPPTGRLAEPSSPRISWPTAFGPPGHATRQSSSTTPEPWLRSIIESGLRERAYLLHVAGRDQQFPRAGSRPAYRALASVDSVNPRSTRTGGTSWNARRQCQDSRCRPSLPKSRSDGGKDPLPLECWLFGEMAGWAVLRYDGRLRRASGGVAPLSHVERRLLERAIERSVFVPAGGPGGSLAFIEANPAAYASNRSSVLPASAELLATPRSALPRVRYAYVSGAMANGSALSRSPRRWPRGMLGSLAPRLAAPQVEAAIERLEASLGVGGLTGST